MTRLPHDHLVSNESAKAGKCDSAFVFRYDGSDSAICSNYGAVAFIDSHIKEPMLLPKSFQPGRNDVVIGRGKKCYNHIGNQILKQLVTAKLDEYSAITKNRREKSRILSVIVFQVRMSGGSFVKIDSKDSARWFDVGDMSAREKVAQTFRDALHDKYRSSNASKNRKRRLEKKAKDAACALSHAYHINLTSCNDPLVKMSHLQSQSLLKTSATDQCFFLPRTPLEHAPNPKIQPPNEAFDEVPKLLLSSFPSDFLDDKNPYEPVPFSEAFTAEGNCSIGSKPIVPSCTESSCKEFADQLEFIATVSDDDDDEYFLDGCKDIDEKLFCDDKNAIDGSYLFDFLPLTNIDAAISA